MTQTSLREFIARVVPWPRANAPGAVNIHWRMVHPQSKSLIWTGRPTHSVDEFVSKVTWALRRSQTFKDIYFCLSLQGGTGRSKNGKLTVVRSQADARALRSIWLDIDIKEAPRGYTDLGEALRALDLFLKTYNLPFPTAIVASGGGMHVYWVSDKDLAPDEWRPYAEGLRAAAVQHGLRCDGGVTVDSARILRVPGTYNYKVENNPRPVAIKHLEPTDIDFASVLQHIAVMAPSSPSVVTATVTTPFDLSGFASGGMASAFTKALDSSESLAAGLGHNTDPLHPTPILAKDGCPFFRDALKTHGRDHGQGLWMLTVLASTFWHNGEAFAHELSNGHPGYRAEETDAMIARKDRERAQRGLGWPSCVSFEREGCKQCAGCPHRGKIKSPLNLAIQRVSAGPVTNWAVPVGENPPNELVTIYTGGATLDELLPEFNKRFAVVTQGQEVLIAKITKNDVQTMTVQDFDRLLANLTYGRRRVRACKEWFNWPGRRQFTGRGIVFDPGGPLEIANDCLNLWRGFAVEPLKGDWSLLHNHIRDVICSGNQSHFDYLMRWMAYSVQYLDKPVGVAVALRGAQGAGKGVLARTFGSLFGKNFAHVTNADQLTGRFNASIGNSCLVFLDEALWAGDKKGEAVLKGLITEPRLQLEAKFRDPIMVDNRLRIMVASNSDWFVPVGVRDRRWFVLDVAHTYAGTEHRGYWKDLYEQTDNGGAAALLYDLLTMDLSGFDIRSVPRTAAKAEQQARAFSGPAAWLNDALQEGRIGGEMWKEAGLVVDTDTAYHLYCEFSKQRREHHPQTKALWSKDVRELLGQCVNDTRPLGPTGRIRKFVFRPLEECRQSFAENTGAYELQWDETSEAEQLAGLPAVANVPSVRHENGDRAAPDNGPDQQASDRIASALNQARADLDAVRKAT